MTKDKSCAFRIWDFGFASSFDIRASKLRVEDAFTLIELLVVISIIIVLAGLVLATSGYVATKGRRSRAEAEIAAISAALESYKADNGIYPRDTTSTDKLDARVHVNSDPQTGNPEYLAASVYLFTQLSGMDVNQTPTAGAKGYFPFKAQLLGGTTNTSSKVLYVRDPFGNSYGYSTAYQNSSSTGYNPTFDLWSTAGGKSAGEVQKWIKNW
jgi:general secretion pathway protein G